MTNTNLQLSETLINLIQKNSESLSRDFKQYLENNNKFSEFTVTEVHPLLYNSLLRELSEQFVNFNKNDLYTKEIESFNYSAADRKTYYDILFWDTVGRLIIYKV
jgi:hypothetical protein